MKCLFLPTLTFFLLSLSGCSIYRSEGRKQFESEAPGKISTASLFQLKYCKNSGPLETWFNQEFPSQNYELVVAENDLEIWRTYRNSSIEVKAIQKIDSTIQSCTYEFANEAVWNAYKEQFIQELEDNVMILEQDFQ